MLYMSTRREHLVAFRISANGLDHIARLAAVEKVSKSEMIRRLLAEAVVARQRR